MFKISTIKQLMENQSPFVKLSSNVVRNILIKETRYIILRHFHIVDISFTTNELSLLELINFVIRNRIRSYFLLEY